MCLSVGGRDSRIAGMLEGAWGEQRVRPKSRPTEIHRTEHGAGDGRVHVLFEHQGRHCVTEVVEADPLVDTDADRQPLRGMGEGIRIDFRLVAKIESEASGKHRYVVSQVPLPDSLKVAV